MNFFRKKTELKEKRLPLWQAEQVVRYMALARSLREDTKQSEYDLINQLSWEIAVWLPEELYRDITAAIAHPTPVANTLTVVISLRKLVLGSEAGNLRADDIAWHAPGVGRKTTLSEGSAV